MLLRRRPGEWGPVEWTVAVALAAAVLAGGGYGGWALWPGKCGEGLENVGGECVGVTDKAFDVDDDGMQKLLQGVEKENAWVEDEREEKSTPYVRIALMMPFTGGDSSSMTSLMVRRAVAGALAAQQEANKGPGPNFQMLLAPNGKSLDKWRRVTPLLSERADDPEAPLVGVTGISSSTTDSKDAVDDLSRRRIPTTAPVTTSTAMTSRYLFKNPPSNEQLAAALRTYLRHHPSKGKNGNERGFLLWDQQDRDIYARDLKRVFETEFGEYGLADDNNAPYSGGSVAGKKDWGAKRIFDGAAQRICSGGYDTVFFAGRDQDLPYFIDELADRVGCKDDRDLRILKVGIGLESTLTDSATTGDLEAAGATVVDAAAVSPVWWQKEDEAPEGARDLPRLIRKLSGPAHLGADPLDDGNAAMYYDSFTFLAAAAGDSFQYINNDKKGGPDLPQKADVYSRLLNSPFDDEGCSDCFQGASGTYGFKSQTYAQWAVCKPVPVIEYRPGPSGDGTVTPTTPLHRTYGSRVDCPG